MQTWLSFSTRLLLVGSVAVISTGCSTVGTLVAPLETRLNSGSMKDYVNRIIDKGPNQARLLYPGTNAATSSSMVTAQT